MGGTVGSHRHAVRRRRSSPERPTEAARGDRRVAVFDDVVLMAPSSQVAFVLNTSGRAIWDLCDNRRTVLAILQELRGRYDAPAHVLLADLTATLRELHRAGLIDFDEATT